VGMAALLGLAMYRSATFYHKEPSPVIGKLRV